MNTRDNELLDVFATQARFCGIFSNVARLRILALLGKRELCVGDIANELGLSMSAVSQHLAVMKDRRAVSQRRDGQNVFYRMRNQKFLRGSLLIREGILEELEKSGRILDSANLD
jgi:DNA-binding transcriptional ArsR family regulator